MHYYKRNLGDYAKKAGRLSMLQHGSYTLLLDTCYDREQFPTLDEAIEWTWASTTEEIEAVTFVLKKFFVLEDGRYVQKRVREELDEFHGKSETNKRIAQERETNRKQNSTNRARTVHKSSPEDHEPPPNQEPRTKNQEPLKEQRERAKRIPDHFPDDDAKQFCKAERPDLDTDQVAEKFRDHWKSVPKGSRLDWMATWRNWVRGEKGQSRPYQQAPPKMSKHAEMAAKLAGDFYKSSPEREIFSEPETVAERLNHSVV